MTKTLGVALDDSDLVALVQKTHLNTVLDSELNSGLNVLIPVSSSLSSVDKWIHTSVKMAHTSGVLVSGDTENWAVWSVLGGQSCSSTGCRKNNDGLNGLLNHSGNSRQSDGLGGVDRLGGQLSDLVEVRDVWEAVLGKKSGLRHHSNSLALGSYPWQSHRKA